MKESAAFSEPLTVQIYSLGFSASSLSVQLVCSTLDSGGPTAKSFSLQDTPVDSASTFELSGLTASSAIGGMLSETFVCVFLQVYGLQKLYQLRVYVL